MKKSSILLAACTTLPITALAQSNVTIYGIMDMAVRYAEGSNGSKTTLSSGSMQSSRLGFRGWEDLGGGLKAGFTLESQINADDGTQGGTVAWHRQSTVNLAGPWGEIRMGRELTPTYLTDSAFDPFYDNGVANFSTISKVLAGNTGYRSDNGISYRLPSGLGGFYGHFQASFSEGNGDNKYAGGALGYRSGPLRIQGAYGRTRTTTDNAYTHATFGVSYDFGVLTLMGHASQKKFGDLKHNHYLLGATVPMGAGTFKVSYAYDQGKSALEGSHAQMLGLGYMYALSKRTTLYTSASYVKNYGDFTYAVTTAPAVVKGGHSRGLEFGINHRF